jgi:HSP20 family molecular chaperone IbpA
MAVPIILSDLALRDNNPQNKTQWSRYRKTDFLYDIVIRINSLEDLKIHGWEILLGKNTEKIPPLQGTSGNIEGTTVAILGAYNRGKTFILSQLCGIRLPHSNLLHTEGISITAGQTNYTGIVFLDTAGTDTPITNDKVAYRRATEAFLREVVVHLSSFIIIVVNRLRATDQIYIDKVLEHCKNQNDRKGIMIIHNLFDVETVADVLSTITNEVEGIFGATQQEKQFTVGGKWTRAVCYSSKRYDFSLTHFILAKDGSPAARICNVQSLDCIMNMLQASSEQKNSLKIISRMIEFMNTRLSKFFSLKNSLEINGNQDNAQTVQSKDEDTLKIVQHEKQPYIVLSGRRRLQNLKENPYELVISEKLIYDDAGYFIKNIADQWQPRYNLCEDDNEVFIVLEMPGMEKNDYHISLSENFISIEGTRANLIETVTALMIHASEIPIGTFKLIIPFSCPVDINTAKKEHYHGLDKIRIQKKRLVTKILE